MPKAVKSPPPISKPGKLGPQPPAICTVGQLDRAQLVFRQLSQRTPIQDEVLTLRQIRAAADYFITKQEWEATS